MPRTQATLYAAELGKDVTYAALSGYGLLRVSQVNERFMPKNAKRMALVLEHLRDGMIDPPMKGNTELMDFARRYPDLTARLFIAIRRLTESLDT